MQSYPQVIALACSPSKGFNSDSMLDVFMDGFANVSKKSIEKIYLSDVPIHDYSYENRSGPTQDENEFRALCDKIMHAEALVIATPTYNFSVPARLKNLIDRIRFFALDFEHKSRLGQPAGKLDHLRVYFIVSGGTPLWAQKILFFTFPPFWLRGVFLYFGAQCLGAIYSGDVKAFENKKVLGSCYHRGQIFARKIEGKSRNAWLERIFFRPPEI